MSNEAKDKITVTKTVKFGMDNYGSADVQVSYSSTAKDGEDADALYSRVAGLVDEKMAEEEAKLQEKADASYDESEPETEEEEEKKPAKEKKSSGGTGLSRLRKRAAKKDEEEEEQEEEHEEGEEEASGESEEETEASEGEEEEQEQEEKKPAKKAPAKTSSVKSAKESVLAKYKLGKKSGKTGSLKR